MTAPTYTPAPVPTPGATAWLVAVEARHYLDFECTTTSTHEWDGYTAANLRAHWAARAKAAHWNHQWADGALTVTMAAVGKTITRTFHDEEPA